MLNKRRGGLKYFLCCIRMAETASIGHQTGVQTVCNILIDLVFITKFANELVDKFCGGCGTHIPLFEVCEFLWFKMMINQHGSCRRLPYKFSEFIDSIQAREINTRYEITREY